MATAFFRRRRTLVALVVLVALFVLLSLDLPISRRVRQPVMTVVQPVLRGLTAVGRWFGRVGDAIVGRGAVAERDKLKREVERLEAEHAALQAELDLLRATTAQLDALSALELTLQPARVIGRDPTSWYDTAVIDAGTGSGVRPGMPVVRGRWYVGRVEESGPGWSRVMLVLDARSTVPATVVGRATRGLVETTSERTLLFKYLADEPAVQVGDRIVTWRATTDDEVTELRFVEGFELGTVATVRGEQGGWQTAVLERPADADRLSEVLVVIGQ
jgi:rod shape-determining protein MreC